MGSDARTGAGRHGKRSIVQDSTTTSGESLVVSRPVSKLQSEDPREFELGQLRRRFNPREELSNDGTVLYLKMAPSDPDFPFEIAELLCTLTVPPGYPADNNPRIRVTNVELKRGFQVNVERGFADLVRSSPGATLLGLFNRLDKQLEMLLSKEMAETMKIMLPGKQQPTSKATISPLPTTSLQSVPTTSLPSRPPPPHVPAPSFTQEQKFEAASKRQAEVRQVVARLGRQTGFIQHADGVTLTMPFQPIKKESLPVALRNQRTMHLIVPEIYPLTPARIELLDNSSAEARQVEQGFAERAKTHPNNALLAQVNYLSLHTAIMAVTHEAAVPSNNPAFSASRTYQEQSTDPAVAVAQDVHDTVTEKSHVIRIARPPEWDVDDSDTDLSSDDSLISEGEDSQDDVEIDTTGKEDNTTSMSVNVPAERGILLSFPGLELYSIELLELVSLSITVRCDRCKDVTDVLRLRNNSTGDNTGMKDASCKKCANNLSAGFRMDLIHVNSSRAGYVDVDGCTVVDMLPSNFVPTCSSCSTPYPAPGVVAVRGDSAMAICRECHQKMTFKIPDIKFLRVSTTSVRATSGPQRKKVKENLGIVAGQELPSRGRCKHYSKSYRWFRFSCCQRVFPCDRCHDESSDHPEEHANRSVHFNELW